MSVAENIYLGQLPTRRGVIDREALSGCGQASWHASGWTSPPRRRSSTCRSGQWQMVEIAKALTGTPSVIAFDEPTSSLSSREIEQLFRVIRQLRDEGKVILYVSTAWTRSSPCATPSRCSRMASSCAPSPPWPRGGPGSAGQDHGGARAHRHLWLQPQPLGRWASRWRT